ncbi:hypothetical protein FVF58_42800 [Paraburkholderia panacisoli]|uniref:Lipase (Class 3) n=1 Tax=Paraburkholderia panacisoli TaxID=2603818 RepID=A0A5B0G8H9_9BURK|nr:hypothetical protein [Paraburkholderia panacisoli]KAA0999045.1 hypothetical protein FVF58_42800 [Paraburkholderia panacisoli]
MKRANAAYIEDAAQSKMAFSALGDVWSDIFKNSSHQAVMSVDASGGTHLSISGTRASNLHVLDLFADVSLEPKQVKGGAVTEGVVQGMQEMWDWAFSVAPAGSVFNVTGHSLGASRTHLTPLFLPPAQIGALHSFEAPKFCDAQFYATYAPELASMVCVQNGADLWAAWPWIDPRWVARPQPEHYWLNDVGFDLIPASQWPGGVNPLDHDVSLVQRRVVAIAAGQVVRPEAVSS